MGDRKLNVFEKSRGPHTYEFGGPRVAVTELKGPGSSPVSYILRNYFAVHFARPLDRYTRILTLHFAPDQKSASLTHKYNSCNTEADEALLEENVIVRPALLAEGVICQSYEALLEENLIPILQ
jgi:hypothetical protein